MDTPFQGRDASVLILLIENTDPNGKHMEYRDLQGQVFARMAKVYKKGGFLNLFPADSAVHAELKDADGRLLLTTASHRGSAARECTVEVHRSDGTLVGTLHGDPFGADFESSSGALLGRARHSENQPTEPKEVLHTYTDASGQTVGTCDRRYPDQSNSLLDFLTDSSMWGRPVQTVTLTAPVDLMLHTFLHLFPALQFLRFFRST